MRWIVAFLMAAALSVPVASAWTADVLLKLDSPSKFVLEAEADIDGQDASEMRMQMDQSGNKDNTVQTVEVEAVEDFFRMFMNQADEKDAEESLGSGFTIDGKGPTGFAFKDFDIRNAEGPVSSTSALSAKIRAEFTFDVQAGQNHTIRIMAQDDGGDEGSESGMDFFEQLKSAKLEAAPGYIFSSTEGLPSGAKVSGDKKTIDFGQALGPTNGESVIVMTRGGGSAPGPSLAVFAVVVVGAVWLARKRIGGA